MKRLASRVRGSALWICAMVTLLIAGPAREGVGVTARGMNAPAMQAAETYFGGYRTVEGIEAFLDRQVAAHPALAEKVDFGDSWCKVHGPCAHPAPGHDGYDLLALRITNREVPGPKPVFWFDAGIHGHEIVPPEIAMRFISWLLDNYETDADARWLVDYHDIWVVPMANPDAHHMGEAGVGEPYLQRKNADNDDGCDVFPPLFDPVRMLGVDLNRNFPFKWDCCEGASDDPCSQVYRGPAPASEEETQAIVEQIRRLIPDQRGPNDRDAAPLTATGVVQSMHSIARSILYPWIFSEFPAPNGRDLANIAAHVSSPQAGGNGYPYCRAGALCGGGTGGTTIDWAYGELGAAAMLIEIEGNSFTPPYQQVEVVWNNNRQALIYLAKLARTPYLTTRGADANSLTVEPRVIDAGARARLGATIVQGWPGNNYYGSVGGAEYYVDTPPWAGGRAAALSPVDGSLDSTSEQVQATLDTGGLAPGRHIIFVRGRGTDSYEGHESWGPVSAVFLDVVQSGGTPVAATPAATAVSRGGPLPPPVALPGGGSRLFPETGKTASGLFLDYWNANGGLAQQGYPISEVLGEVSALNGQAYTMQYFERAVFEYHPENAGTPYEVLLSQLGTFRYREKYPNGAPGQAPNMEANSVLFPQTGKRLGGIFLDYWNAHGGLAQQGYPISDEFVEVSDLNGQPYRVQYFERAVFEHHPENAGTAFEVLLSQLGTFRYRAQYP